MAILYSEFFEAVERNKRSLPGVARPVSSRERAVVEKREARRQKAEARKAHRPARAESTGAQLNLGLGNLGGPGRLTTRLATDGDLFKDLQELNPLWVDEFTARWSKRHALVRIAHVILGAALGDRQYTLEGGTEKARAFHDAWLERALPDVLDHVVDATWYGWQPFLIEWESRARWPDAEGGLPDAWVPRRFRDQDPFWTSPWIGDDGDPCRFELRGESYGADQIFWMTWQQEGENVFGEGQCISAHPFWKGFSLEFLWKLDYFSRSVDPARLAWARNITYQIGEEKVELSEIVAEAVEALANGDTAGLPLDFDDKGNPVAKIETLDLPDRADTFMKGLDMSGQMLFMAALILPGIGLTFTNGQTYASAREVEKIQLSVLEKIGDLPVRALNRDTGPIARAHELNGLEGPPPRFKATPFKREQLETLREMAKAVLSQPIPHKDGLSYRGQDLLDLPAIFRRMDLPQRAAASVARKIDDEPAPGAGGRPQEPLGDRADDRGSGLER